MKTFTVDLHRIAITVRTGDAVEVHEFKTKRAADKKLLRLIAAGYTLDRQEPTSNPEYAPPAEHPF